MLFGLGSSFSGDVILAWLGRRCSGGVVRWIRNFSWTQKSFAFSVLAGASALRVEEKRKFFLGVVILNS